MEQNNHQKHDKAVCGANNKKYIIIDIQPEKVVFDESVLTVKKKVCIQEIADKIEENGLRRPILVTEKNGKYYFGAGGDQFAAAKKFQLGLIRCCVVEKLYPELVFLVENIDRKINPILEAEAVGKLLSYGFKQKELLEILGKSKTYVSETNSLNKLPSDVKEDCRYNNIIPKWKLIETARLKNHKEMGKGYKNAVTAAKKKKRKRSRNRADNESDQKPLADRAQNMAEEIKSIQQQIEKGTLVLSEETHGNLNKAIELLNTVTKTYLLKFYVQNIWRRIFSWR